MNIKQIPAKSISYGGTRSRNSVKAIVIHYTAGTNDTAENQGNYFANGNTRTAGAHFFVDQNGAVVQSIQMDRIAWSVGGVRYSDYRQTGGAKFYGIYTNANTVSIELCDIARKAPSSAMIDAVAELLKYIRKYCPNANALIRHFDVTGKPCPASMTNDTAWSDFLSRVSGSAPKQEPETTKTTTTKGRVVKITAKALNVREKPNGSAKIVTKVKKGESYTIVKEQNGWGKLKSGAGWIFLKYTK